MGKILLPNCVNKDCKSFFRKLYVGYGFKNEIEECNVPYSCEVCGEIIIGNLLLRSHICNKCSNKLKRFGKIVKLSFDDIESFVDEDKPQKVYYIPDKIMVFESNIGMEKLYFIEDKKYKCPVCKKIELEFFSCGMWD